MKSTVLLSIVMFASASLKAAETDWQVGLAQTKITPEKPALMSGYASRVKPSQGVALDLYAKALAIEDRNGQRAILITTDLIGISAAVAEPIYSRITEQTGVKREAILLSWAHNHAGPSLSLKVNPAQGVAVGDAENTVAYTRELQTKLVSLASRAVADLKPAKLAWGNGIVNFVMNRREFTAKGVILGVNPKGPVDRSVPMLRVDSPDDKMRAVLFASACHNTTLTQTNYLICGDYAGYAQEFIGRKFPNVQAMFMLGCGGDANPYPRGTMEDARRNGIELGEEVSRVLGSKLQPIRGPLKIAFDYVALPLQNPSQAELQKVAESGPSWLQGNAKQMLSILSRGEKLPAEYRCPVSVWQFGDDLTLVVLSSEVVVDYVRLIEDAIGPLQLWVAAYCHDYFGYFPSARVLKEGGYETRGLFSGEGWFSPTAQEVLVSKVRELARRAGRRIP